MIKSKWYVEGNSVRVKHSAGGWLRIALVDGGDGEYIPNARLIAAAPALLAACEAWMEVESESKPNHPCPDYTLRATYRQKAVKLTKAALAVAKEQT